MVFNLEKSSHLGQIVLNLSKDILCGWEDPYSYLKVEVIKLARELGHTLPPIDVVKKDGFYQLLFGHTADYQNYGGHSRAITSFQIGEPIICNLFDEHRRKTPQERTLGEIYPTIKVPFEWKDVRMFQSERKTTRNALFALKKCLDYLPEQRAKEFLEKHDIILIGKGKNAFLIDGETYRNLPQINRT